MSVIVFVGVYAIGNPVDILINPRPTSSSASARSRALGLDKPLLEQYLHLPARRAARRSRHARFVFSEPALEADPERMPATLELALVGDAASRSCSASRSASAPACKPERRRRTRDHGRLDPRLLAADFWVGLMLIMVFAVHAAAGCRPAGAATTVDVLGVPLVVPHARRPAPPAPAGAQPRAVQGLAGDPPRRAPARARRCCRTTSSSPAPRACRRAASIGVHVLKNILIPVVTVVGLEFGSTDRLRGGHRDGLRLARHGQAADRLDQPASTGR